MRSIDKAKEKIIEDFIDSFFEEKMSTPSLREIERALNISRQTVQRYLKRMNDNHILTYDGRNILTKKMERFSSKRTVNLAVRGRIVCGDPTAEDENIEGFIEFPVSLLGKGKHFILRAYGDSMIDAGIGPDDLVIVCSQQTASINQIVAAIDDENRNTLKRLMYDGERYFLHPENKEYSDIYPQELRIQGVAVKVIKNL